MTSTYTSRMLAGSSISQLSLHFDRYDTHLTVSRPFFAVVQAATALALSVSETVLAKMLELTSGGGAASDIASGGKAEGSNADAGSLNGGPSLNSHDEVSWML